MFAKRILSGVTMAIVTVLCFLYLPSTFLRVLISIVAVISSWEFFKLRFSSELSLLLSLALLFFLIYLNFSTTFLLLLSSIGFLMWLVLGVLVLGYPHNKNILQNSSFWILSGFVIHISFCTSLFLIISSTGPVLESAGMSFSSRATLIFLIGVTAAMDILAYFGGKRFGKTKFLSNISPNKTLEGFLIAFFGTPLITMLLLDLFFDYDYLKILVVMLCIALFSVLGDASASLFKRISGVKDSSNLIPGHGGVLDRIDSHLAVAPCFILLVFLIKVVP